MLGRLYDGYGFDAWVSPVHRFVLADTLGFSKEGSLPLVVPGFMF